MARKLLNEHLDGYERRRLAYALRDCYHWLKEFKSDECICEVKGKSDGLITIGFLTGLINARERDRYKLAFWNLYKLKRGWCFEQRACANQDPQG